MTIIEVRPCKKFNGAWVAFEAPGVEPAFAAPDAKRKVIDYACGRFGGGTGGSWDESLCNVEILIENEGHLAVTWQCGGEGVDDRS
jgi:hypothetical protein